MNRRHFFTAAASAISGIALASCAPKRFPWPGVTEFDGGWRQFPDWPSQGGGSHFFSPETKLYSLANVEMVDGETFETWMTPNGYVSIAIGPHLNEPEFIHYKFDAIVHHDATYLGKGPAVADLTA